MQNNNPRLLAVQVLNHVSDGGYSNLTLDATIRKAKLEPRDVGLLTTIVYGVIQRQLTLDYLIEPFIAGKKVEDWVRVLLRTAVFQMQYLTRVPKRAIFFDSTEVAKKMGHVGVAKFVTAILRRMDREGFRDLNEIEDVEERLAISTSTPTWLTAKLIEQLGYDQAEAILNAIDTAPNAVVRANHTKINRKALRQRLSDRYPDMALSEVAGSALVNQGGHLAGAPEFAEGLMTMQDESSQLVAPSMRLQPNSKVLDACAAPGGKTTHIAEYLDAAAGGQVTALDLHPHKVRLIEQNAARLGLSDVVTATAMDARQAGEHFAPASFDRVLVDAPCSGLGLIRRKPEIKYEKTQADIDHLKEIQKNILSSVADLVKPGGYLTYSTCTIVREENQGVVADFLANHPNFEQVTVPIDLPLEKRHGQPALQLYPSDYGSDGFFIASLHRLN